MSATRAAAASSLKWSAVEYGGLALISFASLVVYARFLSASQFGLFAIAVSVIELMTVLVSMLFHDALVQRRELRALHYDTAFTASLALSAAMLAACWAVAPWITREAAAPEAGPVFLWLSLSLPVTAASAALVARRRRELDFRTLAMSSLAGRAGGAATGLTLVVLGFGVWGLVAQQLVFVLLGAAVLWLRCSERPRPRFARREFRELIGFGLACVSDLMLQFSTKRLFVVASGVLLGTQGAGLLNLAFRTVDTLWSIASTAVSQITLPLLSSLQTDEPRFRRAFQEALALMCLVSYFAFVLLAATAPEVVVLFFGAQWAPIAPYVTLLALLALSAAVRTPAASVLKALGRPRDLLVCQGVELSFVLAAIAATHVPTVGWAIGIWLVREALGSAVLGVMLRRATRVRLGELLGGARVPLMAAAAMFAAVSAMRALLPHALDSAPALAALASVGALVYFAWVALLEPALLVGLIRFTQFAFRRVQAA